MTTEQDLTDAAYRAYVDYWSPTSQGPSSEELTAAKLGIYFALAETKKDRMGDSYPSGVRTEELGDGVWVLYFYDNGPHAVSIHQLEHDAIIAHEAPYHIAFWPHGMELQPAIALWDKYVLAKKRDFTDLINEERPFG